jgi:hypothetical protein
MQSEKHVEKEKKGFSVRIMKKRSFLRMQIKKDMYKDFRITSQSP